MLRANANSGLPIPRPEPPKTASDPHSRILGTSWSEEMDIIDPIGPGDDGEEPEEDTAGQRRVVEVSQRTEEHLLRSFASMKNADRRRLADGFALPKVAVTRTPSLDTVMSAQCSKTTKTLDKALARIQTLNLDALAPLIDLLEQLNGEKEITSDQVGYAVESAITFWVMLPPRCPHCVGRRYSRSTIGIFCPLPRAERRNSSQQPLSCLGQSSQEMQLSIWNSWQHCGRPRPLPAVLTLRFFGRPLLTKPDGKDPMFPDNDHHHMPDRPGTRTSRRERRIPNDN